MAKKEIDKAVQNLITMTGKRVEIKMAWKNASPTSKFGAQTISCDTAGASFALISYIYANGYVSGGVSIADWHLSHMPFAENFNMFRKAKLNSAGVEFSTGYLVSTYGSQTADTSRIIPTAIYLVKGVI